MSGPAKKCIICEKTKELTEFALVKDRLSSNCKACREKDAEKKRRKRERERAEKREREMDEEDEDEEEGEEVMWQVCTTLCFHALCPLTR